MRAGPRGVYVSGLHRRRAIVLPASGDVTRAVEQMSEQQRASLVALLTELDTAEEMLVAAEETLALAQVELAAARAVKQRRLDAIESLITSSASGMRSAVARAPGQRR
jgi:hypothetical protein